MTNEGGQEDEIERQLRRVGSQLERPIIDTKWTRAYNYGDLVNRSELILHPIDYMTTLVQLGYEPLPPKLSRSIFGRTKLQLPGFFSYTGYIIKTDGFFGIYRGLRYNVAYAITYKFVYKNVDNIQKKTRILGTAIDSESKYKNVENLSLSLMNDTVTRFVALGVSYPLHVMMVRSMAQFIGRETHYDSFWGAILDIYYTGGVSGFYAGFFACFLGQCALLYIESGVVYILRNHLDRNLELWSNSFVLTGLSIVTRSLVYPFRIVSTVMSCNGSSARSLAASAYTVPQYDDWIDCWSTLWRRGEIKRGSSLFWRYQPITSSLMFPMQPLTASFNKFGKRNL